MRNKEKEDALAKYLAVREMEIKKYLFEMDGYSLYVAKSINKVKGMAGPLLPPVYMISDTYEVKRMDSYDRWDLWKQKHV